MATKRDWLAALLILVLMAPSVASAHVSVRPRESKPDAEERYTVRVPTEGAVATTHVRLEDPALAYVAQTRATSGGVTKRARATAECS